MSRLLGDKRLAYKTRTSINRRSSSPLRECTANSEHVYPSISGEPGHCISGPMCKCAAQLSILAETLLPFLQLNFNVVGTFNCLKEDMKVIQ